MEEYIAVMRAAGGTDPVSYRGRFYIVPDSMIDPKPVHRTGRLGVFTPPAIERSARIADGRSPVAFT